MKNKLLVAGTVNIDLSAGLPRFPSTGETLASTSYSENIGGKAANQAVAANRFGAEVVFAGKVGEDAFGKKVFEFFQKEGIDTRYLYKSETVNTGNSFILVDTHGDNIIVTNLLANQELTKEEIFGGVFETKPEAVLLQLEIENEEIEAVLNTISKRGIPLFVNLAPVKYLSKEAMTRIDYLIINEVEAGQLAEMKVTTEEKAEEAAEIIYQKTGSVIIMTLGGKGVLVKERGSKTWFEVPKLEAVDTTAAGDCFCGVLAAEWLQEKDLHQAVRSAIKAASKSVLTRGSVQSLPYKEEIQLRG
ncbi:ribokinase [Alkalicoccus halolimnae]|uniref:Ribokinase n=1 Tax=Alkalicoccus halolimnae TaxID=1667239 RepID=A0AAJ8LX48_9BACI|nr:ribokinase [Alkalicoccus halolimnae]